ncbi:MAG: hypothetical protein R3F34_00450 [Planctomycetota bacterium]
MARDTEHGSEEHGSGGARERYLVVVLAHFATDRVRRELARRERLERRERTERGGFGAAPSAPRSARASAIVLTARSGSTPTVAHRCARAAAAGVVAGSSLAQARGLLFGAPLHTQEHDPAGDLAALERLARAARRYSPRVAAFPPDALALEIKGSERLFGGEQALLEDALRWFARLAFDARAAVASTLGCAFAVARFAVDPGRGPERRGLRVREGRERDALERLPVAALRLPEDVLEGLFELGLATCGDVLRLPASRCRRDSGTSCSSASTRRSARGRRRSRACRTPSCRGANASSRDPSTTARCAGSSCANCWANSRRSLEERELGATKVVIELWPSDGPPTELARTTSRAGRDPAHLWSLVATEIERAPVGFGVEKLAVRAEGLERLLPRQLGASGADGAGPSEHDREYWALVDALRARLGERAAFACDAREDFRPECAFVPRRPELPPSGARVARRERPTRLHREPIAVDVEERDGRPVAFTLRGVRTELERTIGLERIVAPWWPGAPRPARALEGPERTYVRALDADGRWLWLCRRSAPDGEARASWFVHGEWC